MNLSEDIYKRQKELSIYWYNKSSDLMRISWWFSMDDERSAEIVEELGLEQGFSMRASRKMGTLPFYLYNYI